MPSTATKTTVCNLALDIVGELPIQDYDTADGAESRWLRRNFDHVVEVALRANIWSFSVQFHEISADTFTATPRWSYRYSFPPDALRFLPPTAGGLRGSEPIAYEIKGSKILTNTAAPLYADFVMNINEPGQWDPLFVQVIAASLAEGMAHRFTRKNSFLELAMRMKADAIDTAEQVNAFEAGAEPIENLAIVRARYS